MKGAYVFLKNNGVTIGFAGGALLALLGVIIMVVGFPADATLEQLYQSGIFNPAIYITFFLIGIGVLAALVGPIIYTANNPKESVKFLAAFGVLLALFLITYAMGAKPSNEELLFFQGVDNKHLTASEVSFVDGLLIFTYIMTFFATAAFVFSEVWGLLKQR